MIVAVKSPISQTDVQYSFAKTLVDAGRFPSVSAVLQQGVELLRRQTENEALKRAALTELLSQSHSVTFVSGSGMDDRLARMLRRKRQADAIRD